MQAHPDDLRQLLESYGYVDTANVDFANAGRVGGFLRLCEAIEQGLALDNDSRLAWVNRLAQLQVASRQWDHGVAVPLPVAVLKELVDIAQRGWRGPARGAIRIGTARNRTLLLGKHPDMDVNSAYFE